MQAGYAGGSNLNKGHNQKKKKGGKDQNEKANQEIIIQLQSIKMYHFQQTGSGPNKNECQDQWSVKDEKFAGNCFYFAIYDGHGSSGRDASNNVMELMESYLDKNEKNIKELKSPQNVYSFLETSIKQVESKLKQSGLDYSNSGTTACCVFIKGNTAYIANVGDSRCVMFRKGKNDKEKFAIEMSYDHKPKRKDEQIRINKHGGRIAKLTHHDGKKVGPFRVWADDEGPGIAMTRSIGDFDAKKIGLISVPEIQHVELQPYKDIFMVVGSDGLWDVMVTTEVVGFVNDFEGEKDQVAVALVNEAKRRWDENNNLKLKQFQDKVGDLPYQKYARDDITAVVAFFEYTQVDNNVK